MYNNNKKKKSLIAKVSTNRVHCIFYNLLTRNDNNARWSNTLVQYIDIKYINNNYAVFRSRLNRKAKKKRIKSHSTRRISIDCVRSFCRHFRLFGFFRPIVLSLFCIDTIIMTRLNRCTTAVAC